jgi:hypothetical protein
MFVQLSTVRESGETLATSESRGFPLLLLLLTGGGLRLGARAFDTRARLLVLHSRVVISKRRATFTARRLYRSRFPADISLVFCAVAFIQKMLPTFFARMWAAVHVGVLRVDVWVRVGSL